ncbi:uncharacterized protein N7496_004159 [Penicillium cataractarum]|uniref:Uncharacterized protein n=1 Tax=Penicillium cataractarum TaxID=2100454 RepID=A0A9W9VJI7_9EURO|nr:uncharacterized protein N7496_004159 [Penicillium cataractarum]KAJ5381731.1 hypothetical protein N7496_004159 [Penicillium cataractarum]
MERKLSQKALRMRQRFTFSRGRDRAATMPPSGATSTPSSRPRSATTPISSHTTSSSSSTDRTRYFQFDDEPGYFRPASPLLNRQSVSEDLEDDIKQACALLVQSVDRGLPIWPSLQVEHRPDTTTTIATAKVSSPTTSRFYYQGASMSPSAVDNQIKLPSEKMHDSGVAFQPSAASAGAGRFYGSQLSTSRHEENYQDTQRGRTRSRGQSFNTEATPVSRSQSRSRSRSLSPDMFPYSPPQVDTLWPHVKDIYFESSDGLFPETETETETETEIEKEIHVDAHSTANTLGVEGMTWLRASLDIPHLKKSASINVNVTAMPTAAPRRFYSTRQLRGKECGYTTASAGWQLPHSRTPSVDDAASLRSFSSAEDEEGVPHRDFYQLRRSVSSGGLQGGHQQRLDPVYAIVSGGQSRRRKASHLLKKLAGLGRRKDVDGGFEGRRVAIAV